MPKTIFTSFTNDHVESRLKDVEIKFDPKDVVSYAIIKNNDNTVSNVILIKRLLNLEVFSKFEMPVPEHKPVYIVDVLNTKNFARLESIILSFLILKLPNNPLVCHVNRDIIQCNTFLTSINFENRGIRIRQGDTFNTRLYLYGDGKSFERMRFGIEFETCVCENFSEADIERMKKDYPIVSKQISATKNHFISNFEVYTSMLNFLSEELKLKNKFCVKFYDDLEDDVVTPEEYYNTYFATSDSSVHCNSLLKPLDTSKGDKIWSDTDCSLQSVKLVTPVTDCRPKSLENFEKTFDNVIRNENFIYESNNSQSMHINISHPLANIFDEGVLKFLKLWWYFEPVIFTFVPKHRRDSLYAAPLRERFSFSFSSLESWKTMYKIDYMKYTAVRVHDNRFEIRIIPAGMSKDHVFNWLKFCLKFLYASMTKPIIEEDDDLPIDLHYLNLEDKFHLLFDSYIQDDTLKTYFFNLITHLDYVNALDFQYKLPNLQYLNFNRKPNLAVLPELIEMYPNVDWLQSFATVKKLDWSIIKTGFYNNPKYKDFSFDTILYRTFRLQEEMPYDDFIKCVHILHLFDNFDMVRKINFGNAKEKLNFQAFEKIIASRKFKNVDWFSSLKTFNPFDFKTLKQFEEILLYN